MQLGIHLHLMGEYLGNTDIWISGLPISDLLNPAVILGIPNQLGISAIYNGTPIPPTPILLKSKFKWVLYARKLRNQRG